MLIHVGGTDERSLPALISDTPAFSCRCSSSAHPNVRHIPAKVTLRHFVLLIFVLCTSSVMGEEVALVACVTGASGYLGMELTAQLLESGYHVRGTVRDPDNQKKVLPLHNLPFANERLTLVKADLLGGTAAFDDCAEGATIFFHTASPFITKDLIDPYKQLVEPSLRGTEAAVGAALRSTTVNTIILTSSIAATMAGIVEGHCFDEDDWNTKSTLTGSGKKNIFF